MKNKLELIGRYICVADDVDTFKCGQYYIDLLNTDAS